MTTRFHHRSAAVASDVADRAQSIYKSKLGCLSLTKTRALQLAPDTPL